MAWMRIKIMKIFKFFIGIFILLFIASINILFGFLSGYSEETCIIVGFMTAFTSYVVFQLQSIHNSIKELKK